MATTWSWPDGKNEVCVMYLKVRELEEYWKAQKGKHNKTKEMNDFWFQPTAL